MGGDTSINLQLGQQQNYMAYVLTHNLAMQARKQNKVGSRADGCSRIKIVCVDQF